MTICQVFHDTLYLFQFLCDVFCLGRCTQPMYYSKGTERGSETVPEGSIVWPLTKTFCNFVEFYIKYTVALWNFLTWIPLLLYQIYTLMQNPLTQDYLNLEPYCKRHFINYQESSILKYSIYDWQSLMQYVSSFSTNCYMYMVKPLNWWLISYSAKKQEPAYNICNQCQCDLSCSTKNRSTIA